MRALLIGDVIAAAVVLVDQDESNWAKDVAQMFSQAHAADLHRLASGRSHPDWGNGSLMSVARGRSIGPEPYLSNGKYLRALKCVIETALVGQDAFVSREDCLYSSVNCGAGGVRNGRDTCEDGIDRSGLAADM